MRLLLISLALLSFACSDGIELGIDLKTDLVPQVEFTQVEVTLTNRRDVRLTNIPSEASFDRPATVAEFTDLEPDSARVLLVRLLDRDGQEVVSNTYRIDHQTDLSIPVVFTRDCRGVMCPLAPGDPAGCLGGQCVDETCRTGTEPSCPEPECAEPSDCPALSACAAAQCQGGLCVYFSDDICDPGEYCAPETGCLPLPAEERDAGAEDAGSDGAMDAGMDVAPDVFEETPPATAPRVYWPPNGYRVGRPGGELFRGPYRWEEVEGAVDYRVRFSSECVPGAIEECPFSEPGLHITTSSLETSNTEMLTAGVIAPLGTRYYWYVEACNDAGCGPRSRTRYIDLGRLGSDFNGDGFDDLVVGGRHRAILYQGRADTVPTQVRDMMNPVPDATSGFGDATDVGDFNGDGYMDAVIGAPFDRGFGAVMIYLGQSGSVLGSPTVLQNPPTSGLNGFFGRNLCVDDFNADGFDDVAIDSSSGAYICLGESTGVRDACLALDERFFSCGDVDGDGFGDLHNSSLIRYGPDFTRMSASGGAVYLANDVNRDGWIDGVAAGLYPGSPDGFGSPTAALGILRTFDYRILDLVDHDGDGIGEMFVPDGGPSADSPGSVVYASGAAIETPIPISSPCPPGDCRFGGALTAGLDLNGDGIGDAAIGASAGGRVRLLMSSPAGPIERELSGGIEAFGLSL